MQQPMSQPVMDETGMGMPASGNSPLGAVMGKSAVSTGSPIASATS